MKRTPLKRTTGLRRRSWMPRKRRGKPKLIRGEHPEYRAFTRSLPCCVDHEHLGRMEAHHHTARRPLGRRAADFGNTIPLCLKAHTEFHAASGWAKGMNRAQRRQWQDEESARVLEQWAARARSRGVL